MFFSLLKKNKKKTIDATAVMGDRAWKTRDDLNGWFLQFDVSIGAIWK